MSTPANVQPYVTVHQHKPATLAIATADAQLTTVLAKATAQLVVIRPLVAGALSSNILYAFSKTVHPLFPGEEVGLEGREFFGEGDGLFFTFHEGRQPPGNLHLTPCDVLDGGLELCRMGSLQENPCLART